MLAHILRLAVESLGAAPPLHAGSPRQHFRTTPLRGHSRSLRRDMSDADAVTWSGHHTVVETTQVQILGGQRCSIALTAVETRGVTLWFY